MPSKQELKHLRQIFEEEAARILLYHDVIFDYAGFDSEVKIVFVREDQNSPEELTFEMLNNFEKRIKKEINSRWYVGIFFTDAEAYEKEVEDDTY